MPKKRTARDTAKNYVRRKFGRDVPLPYADWLEDVYLAGFEAGRRDMGRQIYEKLKGNG